MFHKSMGTLRCAARECWQLALAKTGPQGKLTTLLNQDFLIFLERWLMLRLEEDFRTTSS